MAEAGDRSLPGDVATLFAAPADLGRARAEAGGAGAAKGWPANNDTSFLGAVFGDFLGTGLGEGRRIAGFGRMGEKREGDQGGRHDGSKDVVWAVEHRESLVISRSWPIADAEVGQCQRTSKGGEHGISLRRLGPFTD